MLATVGVAFVDSAGVPILSNQHLQRMLGFTSRELAGMPFAEFTHPDDVDKDSAFYLELVEGKRDQYQVEKRCIRKDGKFINASLSFSLARSEEGEIRFAIAIIEDISAKIQTTEELQRSHRELRSLNTKLEQSTEQLHQFTYAASHDLKEPLRTIENFTRLLEQTLQKEIALNGQAQEFLGFVQSGVTRMQSMIDGLLELSRTSTEVSGWETFTLDQPVNEALSSLGPSLDESGAVIEIDSNLPEVNGDRALLSQLFQHLFANSIKFSGERKPHFTVTCRGVKSQSPALGVIEVIDNGMGFDPRHADAIFQPFRRFTHRSVAGLGMGLTLCRQIVALHGGSLTADGQKGNGATFSIRIPVKVAEEN